MAPTTTDKIIENAIKTYLEAHKTANLGGFIFGYGIDCLLLGLIFNQLFQWYNNGMVERRHIKGILIWVVLVTTATTVYTTFIIWKDFIDTFGLWRPFTDTKYVTYWALFDTLCCIPVQVFYLERAYRLSQKKVWVVLPIALGMCAEFVGSICTTVRATHIKGFADAGSSKPYVYLWASATLFVDLALTGVIVYYLSKSKTNFKQTDRILMKVAWVTIESALPPTLCAIGFLINSAFCGTKNLSFLVWEIFHGKVYVVVLLAVLNSRTSLQRGDSARNGSSAKSNTFGYDTDATRYQQATVNLELDKIHVETTTDRQYYAAEPLRVGLNRRAEVDEESTVGTEHALDEGDSRVHLTYIQPREDAH